MKLQKFLAHSGISSRRKAEKMITEGAVSVNGKIAHIGQIIDPEVDSVSVNGKKVSTSPNNSYFLLHKPTGYISSTVDPKGRNTVLDLLPKSAKSLRLYPVGRLDYDSKGLVLLTNDGDHAYRLTHPKFEIEKTYKVLAKGKLKDKDINILEKGVRLSDGITKPAHVEIIDTTKEDTWIKITIKEGKNRQIRRMFEVISHPVVRLIRLTIGPYSLGSLKVGEYVEVEKKEFK